MAHPMGEANLNRRGRVLTMNRSAAQVIAANDGLAASEAGLRATSSTQSRALQNLIAEAAATAAGEGTGAGGVIAISRPSLRRPFAVMVTPLRAPPMGWVVDVPAAAVLVNDPEREPQMTTESLRILYGLTPAEARFASALATGTTPKEYSEQKGLSIHTVRGLLKQLLAKTETRRQADLVRLILTGTAGLR